MFFPSPSMCKVVKGYPNHVVMNMIGLAQTSREIIEDLDVPILLVVLITLLSWRKDRKSVSLEVF